MPRRPVQLYDVELHKVLVFYSWRLSQVVRCERPTGIVYAIYYREKKTSNKAVEGKKKKETTASNSSLFCNKLHLVYAFCAAMVVTYTVAQTYLSISGIGPSLLSTTAKTGWRRSSRTEQIHFRDPQEVS